MKETPNTQLSPEEQMLDAVHDIMEVFQKDCHKTASEVMKRSGKPIIVQDVTNVWMWRKLAEFELRLRKLEEAKGMIEAFMNNHTPLA